MAHFWSSNRNQRRHHENSHLPVTLPPPPPHQPPSTLPPHQPPSTSPPRLPPPQTRYPEQNPFRRFPNPSPRPPASNPYDRWEGLRPQEPPPPRYVDHRSALKIMKVNVLKDTIRIEVDEKNPKRHLVFFTFDARVDGSITIVYFGKEGANGAVTPLYPGIYMPVRIPFQKGFRQKFCQPSGAGIDQSVLDNYLSKPSPGKNVFPLVIAAESSLPSPYSQIILAVLEKNDDSHFRVKVIEKILWVNAVRCEVRPIYGVSSFCEEPINDSDSGKDCLVCQTELKDTVILPCSHLCTCRSCAEELIRPESESESKSESDKKCPLCPLCRQPIQKFLQTKLKEGVPKELDCRMVRWTEWAVVKVAPLRLL